MAPLADGPRPLADLGLAFVGLLLGWGLYVPVHELLHAAGCWLAGGTVSRLEIQPIYGGQLLAGVFPFVEAGGSFAGRLSGFDTGGSDLVYLATDALPFALTVLLGVPWLRACSRRRRPLSVGPALVLALAPFVSLTGDCYEMASIPVTALAGMPSWEGLRSDDLLGLASRLWREGAGVAAWSLTGLGAAGGTALAFATYALGGVVSDALARPLKR